MKKAEVLKMYQQFTEAKKDKLCGPYDLANWFRLDLSEISNWPQVLKNIFKMIFTLEKNRLLSVGMNNPKFHKGQTIIKECLNLYNELLFKLTSEVGGENDRSIYVRIDNDKMIDLRKTISYGDLLEEYKKLHKDERG